MQTFGNIKELIGSLKREEKLLSEMFSKRKTLNYTYDLALELVDFDETKIQHLIDKSVIRKNGNYLEIDEVYLQFFEQVLAVNEEINISYINDNIQAIKENIQYFFYASNERDKYKYLKFIKKTFRNIGAITLRNVVDLRRNIENTFKNEPNYKNKQSKLENLDKKRRAIIALVKQTELLIYQEELTFFKTAVDEELSSIIVGLKQELDESTHNLIAIEKQVINYLNQIKYQSGFLKKLRKIKYLKDQFTLRASTDIDAVLNSKNTLVFEPNPSYPVKLSLDQLVNDLEVFESIQKVATKVQTKKTFKPLLAEAIATDYLNTEIEEEILINLKEVISNFLSTGNNLFDFIMQYDFVKEVPFEERVTIYCQMISEYETELNIGQEHQSYKNIEYTMVYPK
ncbi:MAG: hypothetical protein COB98_02660 [Flavobacteriaceae bacterium]|nr:MAG: hypothetical protein COB98_02660 [Flavobacteriaceae bacterium]